MGTKQRPTYNRSIGLNLRQIGLEVEYLLKIVNFTFPVGDYVDRLYPIAYGINREYHRYR